MEADARHVPILVRQFGLSPKSRVVTTPGFRNSDVRGDELDEDRSGTHRSAAMRLS